MEGFGRFKELYYPDGMLRFEGYYKDGKPNGYGKSYYKNGKLQYDGRWVDGVYHGEGTLYDENGKVVYRGEWLGGRQARHEKREAADVDTEKLNRYMEELHSLIGLMDVKKELNQLINFVKLQRIRKQRGLRVPTISLHMVFTGNPGTGKTTVARLMSRILFELGYLSKGHLVETNRAGMVAGYLGQTAIKTEEVVRRAIGGVLFIDEAYALAAKDEYGQEAIDTLLKLMEDYRDNLVVIVAGYPALMESFIASNPGLASRFNKYIAFRDYDKDELLQIFEYNCVKSSYKIADDGKELLRDYIDHLLAEKDETFGNARTMRNLFEQSIAFHANRIMNMQELPEDVSTIGRMDMERCIRQEAVKKEKEDESGG